MTTLAPKPVSVGLRRESHSIDMCYDADIPRPCQRGLDRIVRLSCIMCICAKEDKTTECTPLPKTSNKHYPTTLKTPLESDAKDCRACKDCVGVCEF